MGSLIEVLKDKQVNNLVVGIVAGLATFTFFNSVIVMLLGTVFDTNLSSQWDWNVFFVSLLGYLLLLTVARILKGLSR